MRVVPTLFPCLAAAIAIGAAPGALAAPTSTPVAGLSSAGTEIVPGPNGAMWVLEPASPGRVASIAAGSVSELVGGPKGSFAADSGIHGLAVDTAGGAWAITPNGASEVVRIAPGARTLDGLYTMPLGAPTSLAADLDGRIWGAGEADDGGVDFLVRYTPGAPEPNEYFRDGFSKGTKPRALSLGTGGSLWFLEGGGQGRVGRVDPERQAPATFFPAGSGGGALLAAGDDKMWIARGREVGIVGAADGVELDAAPNALALGPDGAMWAGLDGGVARIAGGKAVPYDAGLDGSAKVQGLAAGADGRLWATLDRAPFLVRITVPPRVSGAVGRLPSSTTATVTADISPNGLLTSAVLEAPAADGSWRAVAKADVGDGTTAPVRFEVSRLAAAKGRTLRVVATNDAGVSATLLDLALEDTPRQDGPAQPTAGRPADGAATGVAMPVQGATVVVQADRGVVTYRVPGSTVTRKVDGTASIPNGSVIDTTLGAVVLSSSVGGKAQDGTFSGGLFKVRQVRKDGMTELYLRDAMSCGPAVKAARMGMGYGAAHRARGRRHLWGSDKGGRFQTHGRDSVATVRGTRWLTTDSCAGTTVKVFEGAVDVAPRGGGPARRITAGKQSFTRHRSR